MATTLYFVRHGRTAWNAEERFRGQVEIELDAVGVAQAQATARRLSNATFDAAYASRFGRALRTAEIIAAPHGLNVIPLEGLNPLDYGEWTGLTPEEAHNRDPELYQTFRAHIERARFPNGESLDDVRERVVGALAHLTATHPDQTLLAVSHQLTLRVMLCAVLDIDNSHYWDFGQDLCCINIVKTRGDGRPGSAGLRWPLHPSLHCAVQAGVQGLRLQTMNDVCHLQEEN